MGRSADSGGSGGYIVTGRGCPPDCRELAWHKRVLLWEMMAQPDRAPVLWAEADNGGSGWDTREEALAALAGLERDPRVLYEVRAMTEGLPRPVGEEEDDEEACRMDRALRNSGGYCPCRLDRARKSLAPGEVAGTAAAAAFLGLSRSALFYDHGERLRRCVARRESGVNVYSESLLMEEFRDARPGKKEVER